MSEEEFGEAVLGGGIASIGKGLRVGSSEAGSWRLR